MLKLKHLKYSLLIAAMLAANPAFAQEEGGVAAEAPAAVEVPTTLPAKQQGDVLEPASSPFAQVAREQEIDEKDKKKARPRKFLAMTLGVEFDEKLPPIPSFVSFKGDYKKIVSVMLSKEIKALRFTPLREGVGTLTVHDSKGRVVAEYRIEVRKSRLDTIMREMQGLLGDIEGINMKIVNNKVVVDGQILLPRDMSRIYNVVNQYGDLATSIVTMSPMAQKKIAEFIARDINNPDISVRAVNDKFVLEGVAKNEDEKNRAEVIAKMYLPDLVMDKAIDAKVVIRQKPQNDGIINLITVAPAAAEPPKKIIQLIVHYVELHKDYEKGFRFQFTPEIADGSGISFQSGDGGGGATTTISGTISNLLPKLNWAKEHGYGRVLQSSSLIVSEGKKGVLNSFQEVPFQTVAQGGGNAVPVTSFKKVGMQSSITPFVSGERSDSISLTIEFEISSMSAMTAAGPTTSNNQMQTDISVRSGQSAAIGGLITNNANTAYNKLPPSVNNPIISLYASKQFQRNQSQFVVFVTPIIKSSASAGSEKIKKKFRLQD